MTAEITAAGLDFPEDDGGLGAILGTVRVRLDAETLQALLGRKIAESSLPAAEKTALREKLRAFGGRMLERVVWKAIEIGLENPDALRSILQVLATAGGGHLPPTTMV